MLTFNETISLLSKCPISFKIQHTILKHLFGITSSNALLESIGRMNSNCSNMIQVKEPTLWSFLIYEKCAEKLNYYYSKYLPPLKVTPEALFCLQMVHFEVNKDWCETQLPKEWSIWLEASSSDDTPDVEKIWEKCGFNFHKNIHGHLIYKKLPLGETAN